MTKEQFNEKLLDLAAFYQKDMRPETAAQWFKEFGWMEPFKMDIIVREAKKDCDKFPAGKYFHDQIRNHNFAPRLKDDMQVGPLATVVCRCGEGFAVLREELSREGAYFPAWDGRISGYSKGCQNCGAMYSGELILKRMKIDIATMPQESA